jgi:hypothetical protein
MTLAVVTLILGVIVWQHTSSRRRLEHREYELQADWLVRAGIELGAARLLEDPRTATSQPWERTEFRTPGNSADEMGQIRVQCAPVPDTPDVYRVRCDVVFPVDATDQVRRTAERHFRRKSDGTHVLLDSIGGQR